VNPADSRSFSNVSIKDVDADWYYTVNSGMGVQETGKYLDECCRQIYTTVLDGFL
jgi:hypothetical protein